MERLCGGPTTVQQCVHVTGRLSGRHVLRPVLLLLRFLLLPPVCLARSHVLLGDGAALRRRVYDGTRRCGRGHGGCSDLLLRESHLLRGEL